jgi:serine-type D-Ala-D-Ala carboxypeptidase/endopeptidase (penicillin-binding protein 4)
MLRSFFIFIAGLIATPLISQEVSVGKFIADSSLMHASVSLCVKEVATGSTVLEYNSAKSLMPASVQKLITSAVALEMLGPDYSFKTEIGYSGILDTITGVLRGNIIIKGGGDPSLGSENFSDHYRDFPGSWTDEIIKLGIKKIDGRILTDDSFYDLQPVPSKWLWEDEGNYYGAGVYGLSVFDNTYEIHLNTTSGDKKVKITRVNPPECSYELTNRLAAYGTADEGYVYSAPFSNSAWLEGSVPAGKEDFILRASIPDPPLLLAKIFSNRLREAGIPVSEEPSSERLVVVKSSDKFIPIAETTSPKLSDITLVLNHESVNLYAEHLIKELARKFGYQGSTATGVEVIMKFLRVQGISTDGLFMEDGSGLSPLNAVSAGTLSEILLYMKNQGKYFTEYFSTFPEPGKDGTLKRHFLDPVFDSRIRAKTGSMTRVRSYAGYLTTIKGNEMVFCFIVNNYSGSSPRLLLGMEDILKQIILNK